MNYIILQCFCLRLFPLDKKFWLMMVTYFWWEIRKNTLVKKWTMKSIGNQNISDAMKK